MTRKEKYHADPVYRAKVNKRNLDNYYKRKADPLAAKVIATHDRINNARVAIAHHEERAKFFFNRLERDLKLLEVQQAAVAASKL